MAEWEEMARPLYTSPHSEVSDALIERLGEVGGAPSMGKFVPYKPWFHNSMRLGGITSGVGRNGAQPSMLGYKIMMQEKDGVVGPDRYALVFPRSGEEVYISRNVANLVFPLLQIGGDGYNVCRTYIPPAVSESGKVLEVVLQFLHLGVLCNPIRIGTTYEDALRVMLHGPNLVVDEVCLMELLRLAHFFLLTDLQELILSLIDCYNDDAPIDVVCDHYLQIIVGLDASACGMDGVAAWRRVGAFMRKHGGVPILLKVLGLLSWETWDIIFQQNVSTMHLWGYMLEYRRMIFPGKTSQADSRETIRLLLTNCVDPANIMTYVGNPNVDESSVFYGVGSSPTPPSYPVSNVTQVIDADLRALSQQYCLPNRDGAIAPWAWSKEYQCTKVAHFANHVRKFYKTNEDPLNLKYASDLVQTLWGSVFQRNVYGITRRELDAKSCNTGSLATILLAYLGTGRDGDLVAGDVLMLYTSKGMLTVHNLHREGHMNMREDPVERRKRKDCKRKFASV
jgi:hypothetical protein